MGVLINGDDPYSKPFTKQELIESLAETQQKIAELKPKMQNC